MIEKLSYEKFIKLAAGDRPVAVYREISGGRMTPTAAFAALGEHTKGATLLESGLVGHLGRYSFLHLNPFLEIAAIGHRVTIREDKETRIQEIHPIDLLRSLEAENRAVSAHFLTNYTGGLVGYMGYDSVRLFEDIPNRHQKDNDPPDLMFRRYRDTVAFDHQKGTAMVASLATADRNPEAAYQEAMGRIDDIVKQLSEAATTNDSGAGDQGAQLEIRDTMDDAAFKRIVEKAKHYIRAGDIFQVVLSRAFEVSIKATPFDVYRALRLISPAPFSFYLDMGDQVIVGASPEKLLSLEAGLLEICPLAGTRPRAVGQEDVDLETDLVEDPKERAEHMMLVDLARNDLGAISVPGSVKVSELMKVQRFSHVMHISSRVEAVMEQGCDVFDALRYAFPAGTLSGAPKIRAMEIIDELETARRKVYGGAVCAFDNGGNLNSCIVIRTVVFANGIASVRAGAGIVADSDPQKEADETRHKARAVIEAISLAERGLV
jgi:anthranilate synthase component 1